MHHIMHYNLLRLAPNNVYIRLVINKEAHMQAHGILPEN